MVVLIVALLFLNIFQIFAQTGETENLPQITPPSPTAYELGKFGQIPVGLFTGTPNVSVPILNYKVGNISLPISLSYSSNGIKVDQLTSIAGLGWNLNIGGVINRIVRDEPDEMNNGVLFPEEEIHEAGIHSPMALDYFKMAGENGVDTEVDLYSYNFMGYSGSFIFDSKHNLIKLTDNDLRIVSYNNEDISGYKIISAEGVQYIFSEQELTRNRASGGGVHPESNFYTTAWYLSEIIDTKGAHIYFDYESYGYNYELSKSETITVATPLYQAGCSGSGATGPGYTKGPVITNTLTVSGKRLVKIRGNKPSSGVVDIAYGISHPEVTSYDMVSSISLVNSNNSAVENFNFEYLLTANKRVFLSKITERDPNKFYTFAYNDPEGLVSRLSKAQDHWGYYNGKNSNINYFPNPSNLNNPSIPSELSYFNIGADKSADSSFNVKGMLEKVYYPTKGYTQLEYESNSYNGEITSNPPEAQLYLQLATNMDQIGEGYSEQGIIPEVKFDHMATLIAYGGFNSQDCQEDLNKSKGYITVTDNQTGNPVEILEKNQEGYSIVGNGLLVSDDTENHTYFVNLQKDHSYTVVLSPRFTCVKSDVTVKYYGELPTSISQNILAGGVRIKRTLDYTYNQDEPVIKRYYYGAKETPLISSGMEGVEAYYTSKSTNRINCGSCSYVDQYFTTLNSSSIRPLFNSTGNSTTYYKYITISNGGDNFENGGEENEFIINEDVHGNPLIGDYIQTSPRPNTGWNHSLLKRKIIFKLNQQSAIIPLKEIENEYKKDNRVGGKVYGYTVNKKFDLTCVGDITYECTSSDVNSSYSIRICRAEHHHIWNFGFFDTKCIASGNDNDYLIINHPCYQKAVGSVITYPDMLENLDITEYFINSYWYYLNKTIERNYSIDGDNPVEKVTQYYYDNEFHKQQTRIVSTRNDGNKMEEIIWYPDDVKGVNSIGNVSLTVNEYNALELMKSLKDDGITFGSHQINSPVQVETRLLNKDGQELSKSIRRTNYKDWSNGIVLPKDVEISKGFEDLDPRIEYMSYDNYGNPTEVKQVDGTTVSYFWGYNGQYPIVKIENASYSEIALALSTTKEVLKAFTESNLSTINSLRSNLPKAQVTTYTYEPLVGVKTITDPRGLIIRYIYDDFNRLKEVRDVNDNLLEDYSYKYKELN